MPSTLKTPDLHADPNERGRRAILDAERELHERSMQDPQYAARQPTEREREVLASLDAAEVASRAAIAAKRDEVDALSRSQPDDEPQDRPRFDLRGILLPPEERDWNAQQRDLDRRAAAQARFKSAADELEAMRAADGDLLAANNDARRAISLAGQARAVRVMRGASK